MRFLHCNSSLDLKVRAIRISGEVAISEEVMPHLVPPTGPSAAHLADDDQAIDPGPYIFWRFYYGIYGYGCAIIWTSRIPLNPRNETSMTEIMTETTLSGCYGLNSGRSALTERLRVCHRWNSWVDCRTIEQSRFSATSSSFAYR